MGSPFGSATTKHKAYLGTFEVVSRLSVEQRHHLLLNGSHVVRRLKTSHHIARTVHEKLGEIPFYVTIAAPV